MKHITQIQYEFVKQAGWRDRSPQYQRQYLRRHPRSHLRPTFPGMEVNIDIEPRFYDKATKTFSFELSDVPDAVPARIVFLRNPKTGGKVMFAHTHTDTDATDEDVYGWNYESVQTSPKGKYKLLMIND